jgi:hypothetical protein
MMNHVVSLLLVALFVIPDQGAAASTPLGGLRGAPTRDMQAKPRLAHPVPQGSTSGKGVLSLVGRRRFILNVWRNVGMHVEELRTHSIVLNV